MRIASLITAVCCSLSWASMAKAAEPGPLNWGPGHPGTDFGVLPPIPGIFLNQKLGILNSSHNNGNDGDPHPALDFKQKGVLGITQIMGVWPVDLGGVRTATQLTLPYGRMETDFKYLPVEGAGDGLSNIGVTQIFDYALDANHHIGGSLGYTSKSPSYDSTKALNFGNGYSSLSAHVAYNYFDPSGLDFGIMTGYLHNRRNDSTGYKTGDMIGVDFKMTYALTDKLRIGAYGGYLTQIEDDELGSGASVPHNRFRGLALGPHISWDIGHAKVSTAYIVPVDIRNASEVRSLWFSLKMPLYVPPPPPGAQGG